MALNASLADLKVEDRRALSLGLAISTAGLALFLGPLVLIIAWREPCPKSLT